jgi:hypothetical protein
MKYIKSYEDNINTPQIGDYVIATTSEGNIEVKLFIRNNIGQIKDILMTKTPRLGNVHNLKVYYQNTPEDLLNNNKDGNYWWIKPENILHYSKNKEELETLKIAKKYNL